MSHPAGIRCKNSRICYDNRGLFMGGERMNELVYLFELDSVRNSPQEILLGQQALFREIALKGNRVVLSFNQLTDSESFLSAVRTPDLYPWILSLFSQGVMKYSRFAPGSYNKAVDAERLSRELTDCRQTYGELFWEGALKEDEILPSRSPQRIVRSGSHYVQNAVERCLNSSDERFLFSALPFRSNDKPALSAIRYALRYSDPSILDELHGVSAGSDPQGGEQKNAAGQKERLAFAKTYVELILRLSREPLAYNPPNLRPHPAMKEYLKWVLDRCKSEQPPRAFPLWNLLRQGAERLESLWPSVQGAGQLNDRSDWHAAFRKAAAAEENRTPLCMAEAIVDLCYNYTVEASIQGLAHSCGTEEEFWPDFLRRLPPYWEEGQRGVHAFLKPDSTEPVRPPAEKELPKWDTAARLVRHVPGKNGTGTPSGGAGRGLKSWKFCVASSLFVQIRSAAMYMVLFTAVSLVLDTIEDRFVSLGEQVLNPYILPLVTIVVFGVLGSQISERFGLLDIWDSFKQFGAALRDGVVLLHAWWRERRS